ncbi:hypothetical protein MRX96_044668 [Rhipicephalus microplus]
MQKFTTEQANVYRNVCAESE